MEDPNNAFGQTFSPSMLMGQTTVFGSNPAGSIAPADAPDPNNGNNKPRGGDSGPTAATLGMSGSRTRQRASDEALEKLFWREVPQDLWDRVVLKRGVPGVIDSSEAANKAVEAALHDPRVHKNVDVTQDGLRRFFDAVDENQNNCISMDELHEGFQRTLNDFGLWDEGCPQFRAYWEETWRLLLEELAELRRSIEASTHGGGPHAAGGVVHHGSSSAVEEQDPFSFEAFAGLLRRLKLELALRALNDKGTKDCPLPVLKSIVKIDIDGNGRVEGGRRRSSIQLEEEEVVLKTYTWNARDVQGLDITRRHMREFFLTSRAPQWTMRWIIADSCDRANIIRLAIKYRFHPLHLEDVLKLDRQQPRFLKYGGHYLIILPLLRLVQDDDTGAATSTEEEPSRPSQSQRQLKPQQQQQPSTDGTGQPAAATAGAIVITAAARAQRAGIYMEKSRIAIFAAGPPNFDTIISIHGAWKRCLNRCASLQHQRKAGGPGGEVKKGTWELKNTQDVTHDTFLTPSVAPPQAVGRGLSVSRAESEEMILTGATIMDDGAAAEAPTSVLTAAAALLHEDYSSVRQGNSNWMLHAMLETSAKMLAPIVAAYDRRLRAFQRELEGPDSVRVRDRLGKPIMDMKHDLLWLQKRAKSLKPVIRSLISERCLGDEVVFYIQGVDDEVEILCDDIATMLTLTQGLLDESKYIKDDTRNESLKLFAVVTTTLAPLQLLSGYFGMNFWDVEHDKSSIPLMNHPYGPTVFWVACVVMAVVFLAYCKFSRHWI